MHQLEGDVDKYAMSKHTLFTTRHTLCSGASCIELSSNAVKVARLASGIAQLLSRMAGSAMLCHMIIFIV